MRVPGWKTAKLAGRWLRGRIRGGGLILGYHRVADVEQDPFGICVRPRHFGEQMEALRAAAVPLGLGDMVRGIERGTLARGTVAVTFDDGYADVARHAEPVLSRLDVSATVFVVSGSLGRRLWWDELARLVLEAPGATEPIRLDLGSDLCLDLGTPDARSSALRACHEQLVPLDAARRAEVLEALRVATGAAAPAAPENAVLDEAQLVRLARSGPVEIGSHTVSHAALGGLDDGAQLRELSESRERLQAITGCPVGHLAYPHGSYSASTPGLARRAGYRAACASRPDVARRGGDPYRLPRFWVPDWDGERFARWLRWWRT